MSHQLPQNQMFSKLLLFLALFFNPSVEHFTFPATHYRQAEIQEGITASPPFKPNREAPRVKGGVVSHHLLASNQIAKYFQNLSLSSYKTVVIIGPNHGELGNNHLVTSNKKWDTPYGQVLSNLNCVASIVDVGGAVEDDNNLANDHTVEVLMPYVKYYLSGAQVVPLLVSAKTNLQEIDKLVLALKKYSGEDTLFLVSSDFSHYLLPSLAKVKDQESIFLIKSEDISKIMGLGNDHVDSGASVAILIRLMQEFSTTSLTIFDHTDASTIVKNPNIPTTSYFFLNYYAK